MVDTAQFPPGEMVDDKYRIDRLLSVGGMGAVYVGTHTLLKKRVAIKVLRTELAGADGMVERFQREAVAASAIGHDNIVSVTDMGKTRGGVAFLVMELLEGRSLAAAIKDEGPLSPDTACDIAGEILAGINAAHKIGIVHRDLKPENVFLAKRPGRGELVKILDFGISSIADHQGPDRRLTMTGVVLGTPYYMAPEQARGDREITGAVDVYATGVILYEMLTRGLPYEAENYNLLVFHILSGNYIRISQRRSDIPRELEAIVDKAMAADPKQRFASAEEFAEALVPFRATASGSGLVNLPTSPRSRPHGVPTPPHQTPQPAPAGFGTAETMAAPTPAPLLPVAPPPKRRKPIILALVAVVAAAAAAVLAIMVLKGPKQPQQANAATPPPTTTTTAPPAEAATTPPPVTPPPTTPPPVEAAKPVAIEFMISPADAKATVTIDGKPLEGNRLEVQPGKEPVVVAIAAPGYETFSGKITPDHSQSLVVPLVKERRSHGGHTSKPNEGHDGHEVGTKDNGKKIVTDSPYGP